MAKWWVLLGVLVGCGDDGGDRVDDAATPTDSANPHPELDLAMRDQIAKAETGELTAAQLVAGYQERITEIDHGALPINAFIAVSPTASGHATEVDPQHGGGKLLQAAVIAVKDNIDTMDQPTTAGSLALMANVPAADATVIAKLRAENGIVLGKTNLSEWANFRGNMSSSGWSAVGGQTNNGFAKGLNPCGSSSGSAAAVRAGMTSAALGTETSGSIICPASTNGVVGFKPTVGLVSRAGVIPVSSTFDTVGPITRTVGDAARLLHVIAGPDAADPATANIPANFDYDFEAKLGTVSLSGLRIGVITNLGFSGPVNTVFDREKAKLVAAGAVLVDITVTDLPTTFNDDVYRIMYSEFKDGIDAYLASHPEPNQPTTLQGLIDFNTANAATELKYFGQEAFVDAQASPGATGSTYTTSKMTIEMAYAQQVSEVLDANNVVVLIAPSTEHAWKTQYASGDPASASAAGIPAAFGMPHLTVPMGLVDSLPVGMSFFGRRFDDAQILAVGYAYEQLRGDLSRVTSPPHETPPKVHPAARLIAR
ncbi:MAG: amidase family protein [Kofleriaceae bacterium]